MEGLHWSEQKNKLLFEQRGITFEEIVAAIEAGYLINKFEHPSRRNQSIMVVMVDGYPWGIPYVIMEDGSFFLKTAYPNRKRK